MKRPEGVGFMRVRGKWIYEVKRIKNNCGKLIYEEDSVGKVIMTR